MNGKTSSLRSHDALITQLRPSRSHWFLSSLLFRGVRHRSRCDVSVQGSIGSPTRDTDFTSSQPSTSCSISEHCTHNSCSSLISSKLGVLRFFNDYFEVERWIKKSVAGTTRIRSERHFDVVSIGAVDTVGNLLDFACSITSLADW